MLTKKTFTLFLAIILKKYLHISCDIVLVSEFFDLFDDRSLQIAVLLKWKLKNIAIFSVIFPDIQNNKVNSHLPKIILLMVANFRNEGIFKIASK